MLDDGVAWIVAEKQQILEHEKMVSRWSVTDNIAENYFVIKKSVFDIIHRYL